MPHTKTPTTLATLLKEQAKKLDGFVYSTYPYSCGLTEALVHAEKYRYPVNAEIEELPDSITITLPPLKGSGKRKPFTIKLWVRSS